MSIRRLRNITAIAVLLGGFALAPRSAEAVPLAPRLFLSLETASVGETFTFDVGIGNVLDLFDYQFEMYFDPTILRAEGVTDGGFLDSPGGTSIVSVNNTTGLMTVHESLFGGSTYGTSGSGVLGSIIFTALAAGISEVGLTNVVLHNSYGNGINAQFGFGQVDVHESEVVPVPEPSTLLLMTAGLAFGYRRLRKGATATAA